MERKIILENERTYSRDEIRKVSLDMLKYKAFLLYIVLGIAFILLGSGFIGLSFVFDNDITILTSGIIIVALAFVILGMYIFVKLKINRTDYKETIYKYSFYNDQIMVSIDAYNNHNNMILQYKDVVKVVKRNEFTFIFINKQQALFFYNTDLNDEVYSTLKNNVAKYKG